MPSTHPVQDVLQAATVPANRPIDNLRRAGTGLFVGNCIGTVVAILAYGNRLQGGDYLYVGLLLVGLSFLFLAPWILRPRDGAGVPVVARTLETSESIASRLTRRGLRVPVVVQPIDDSPPFRSFVTLGGMRKKDAADPEVGTLLALQQVEPNMGELAAVDHPSEPQKQLMARLKKHPRKLKSNAPVLPMRRGPLEAKPVWAGGMLASTCMLGVTVALGTILTVTA